MSNNKMPHFENKNPPNPPNSNSTSVTSHHNKTYKAISDTCKAPSYWTIDLVSSRYIVCVPTNWIRTSGIFFFLNMQGSRKTIKRLIWLS